MRTWRARPSDGNPGRVPKPSRVLAPAGKARLRQRGDGNPGRVSFAGGCLAVLLVASVARAETVNGMSAVEQPWDQSVQLERAGDLRGAEAVLVAAWGRKPNNFYAQLRLAYLALITKRANAAVARYKRARRFPEAEGDADAAAGYAAALALKGWQLADAGRPSEARACWGKALAVKPDQPDALAGLQNVTALVTEPEVWGALVGESFGSGRYHGLAVFGQLPWRFFDRLTLRAAGRHIEWRQASAPSPWTFPGQSSANWTVNEIYGGAGYDTPSVTAEALGFAITSTGSSTIAGAGARLRMGRTWGAFADLAALRADGRWVNEQIRPVAFLVLDARFVLHAGARLTHEESGTWASGVAGASLLGGPLSVYLQGHFGTEHWAANLGSPSLLSITPRTRSGGTVTLLWDATRALRVAGQAEAYTLAADGATGVFWSVSLGLQLRIFSL
jgi:tetratricopeptide (TPR) repeat protein